MLMYVRSVDDILINFNKSEEEEKNKMMGKFNNHHPKLSFTNEYEEDNKINFLDLTLLRGKDHVEFDIKQSPNRRILRSTTNQFPRTATRTLLSDRCLTEYTRFQWMKIGGRKK